MTTAVLRAASSLRTSAVIIAAVVVVLLAGLLAPPNAIVPKVAIAAAVLFAIHLAIVLAARVAPTLRRMQRTPPSVSALLAWTSTDGALAGTHAIDWSPRRVLRGFGYRAHGTGDGALWAIKHRTAPLGFVLFHASFLVLAIGAATMWVTRFVAVVRVAEGQPFSGAYDRVLRHAPLGDPQPPQFSVASVDARFERGEAVDLAARLRIDGDERVTRVNHPAEWRGTSIVIQDVGVAPVIWLQDAAGFTLDRVEVLAEHARPTVVPLAGGRKAIVDPHVTPANFPTRDALNRMPIDVRLIGDGARVVVPEVRYWVALRIVRERGGAILVIGFVLAVTGLVWRLFATRREIALTWDATSFRIAGAGELFPLRFRDELDAIAAALRSAS